MAPVILSEATSSTVILSKRSEAKDLAFEENRFFTSPLRGSFRMTTFIPSEAEHHTVILRSETQSS
jgi:hypothetical protein